MALQFLRQCSPGAPRVWSSPCPGAWWETTVPGFTDCQWLQHFRVSRATFSFLCNALRQRLKRQDTRYRLPCIPLGKRVALALYKLAHPDGCKAASELFGVGLASAGRCMWQFCSVVVEVLGPQLATWPVPGDLPELAEHFYQVHGVPGCVGVIGHVPVPVARPLRHRARCEGRGLMVSLQVVVDAEGCFWSAEVGHPEQAGDGSGGAAWACQDFPARMQHLLGAEGGIRLLAHDQTLPQQAWLLRPHRTNGLARLTEDQELFNARVQAAQWAAGLALARLTGRWRCLARRPDCSAEAVPDMARACCVLHNLCERNADTFLPEWFGAEVDDKTLTDLEAAPSWLALPPLEGW
ncbi:hypothetical protein NHX12_009300 [Muraenolepis orangiensis]|uniref:DDE Tnp4 domain-containing protein n=1 Tax=Muraenolepis orangiensis TaxID=630683 RepID=A0A9Q0IAP9_9TELE|nr:hypothetical protein NHX12_009300 [Muraenolepis orangiensis]